MTLSINEQVIMADIDDAELDAIVDYWNAANYLTVAQIYLQSNALLREPLMPDHIKPRLLGHWGTSPGLNLIYAQLNRLITKTKQSTLLVTGPGHGGPAIVANLYLEGTYSEFYPQVSRDAAGLEHLVRQFSTPGGIPSHVGAATPGSLHEGGELGYALAHAFGAAFDNPHLLVACVVGDGEAETGPLAASWKSSAFLNPRRDGAVLPILHLNGYKISGPTVMGRMSDDDIAAFLASQGWEARFVEGDDPRLVHRHFAHVLEQCHRNIAQIQHAAREAESTSDIRWPAIVLRTPKGWTGPNIVDNKQVEGTFRSHQVPLSGVRENSEHLAILDEWMHGYRPELLFDTEGRLVERLQKLAPQSELCMGVAAQANGGKLRVPLSIPDIDKYALEVTTPAKVRSESTRKLGELLRDIYTDNEVQANFRLFCPDETDSNRLSAVFDVTDRTTMQPVLATDDHESPGGRVMEVLSEHLCEGWLEGYLLSGRHGMFATYEAFSMVAASMIVQHAKWLEEASHIAWRLPVSSLNLLLTSTCWRNDHNGFSHQGPGLINTVTAMQGKVARIYLPPDANCLLSISDHCLRSTDYVNLIVIDKQPQLQYLSIDEAIEHCNRGMSTWEWAGNNDNGKPDVVLACAGDVMTMETLAAAQILRKLAPDLRVRVVNVVDLMRLASPEEHPHGATDAVFEKVFGTDVDVVFAFHGYPQVIHQLLHGRANPGRFHVRGFTEQGTTTTPFDMVVLNSVSRFDLAAEAVHRSRDCTAHVEEVLTHCEEMLKLHKSYITEHLQDMPEVRDWVWT